MSYHCCAPAHMGLTCWLTCPARRSRPDDSCELDGRQRTIPRRDAAETCAKGVTALYGRRGGHGRGGYIAWILSRTGRRLLLLLLTSDEICLGAKNKQTLGVLSRLLAGTTSRIGTIDQTYENMEPLLLVNTQPDPLWTLCLQPLYAAGVAADDPRCNGTGSCRSCTLSAPGRQVGL